MLSQRRWMCRPHRSERAKLPQAAFDTCPDGYEGDLDKWRYAWTTTAIWATIEQALQYWGEHEDISGLCYVLNDSPLLDDQECIRLVCFDFDGAIDDEGVVDPDVGRFLAELDTYTEISLGGHGLHAFVFVFCESFRNILHFPIGGCKVDIFCRHQIAITGDVFENYETLNTVSVEVLERFPRHASVDKNDSGLPDFWNEPNDGLRPDHKYLGDPMTMWKPCIEGQGGDKQMFKAACYLARHGVTGWDAFNFLANVEQIPPFTDEELQHKVECAWFATHAENEFGVEGLGMFNALPLVEDTNEELLRVRKELGIITTAQLAEVEDPTFLIENLFVDREALFIGGREKSFKTGLAADLAISLATATSFLGAFPVKSKRRVVFFTAEIGNPAIKLWVQRICRQKGIGPIIPDLLVSPSLPNLQLDKYGKACDPVGRGTLKRAFELDRIEVAIFDPLYFALLGTSLGDMNAVGGVLRNITTLCNDFGIWPIICHHARKDSTKDFQPMSLGDLSGSGVPAFARQWLLLSHAEEFANGRASLYARAGGSTPGDRGLWRIGIDEGMEDEIVNRRWNLTVSSEKEHESHDDAREQVITALRYFGTFETVGSICLYTGLDLGVARDVLRDLVQNDDADLQNSKYQIKG